MSFYRIWSFYSSCVLKVFLVKIMQKGNFLIATPSSFMPFMQIFHYVQTSFYWCITTVLEFLILFNIDSSNESYKTLSRLDGTSLNCILELQTTNSFYRFIGLRFNEAVVFSACFRIVLWHHICTSFWASVSSLGLLHFS